MITTEHGYIRTADPDDAWAVQRLYNPRQPRAALLDQRREPIQPTADELRELLGRKEAALGAFFTIEDATGSIAGFCGLRGMNTETASGELTLMPIEDAFFETALGEETFAFLYSRAFDNLRLHKLLAHCLEGESALRDFLMARGFTAAGVQREVYYGLGRWHDLHLLTLNAPQMAPGAVHSA